MFQIFPFLRENLFSSWVELRCLTDPPNSYFLFMISVGWREEWGQLFFSCFISLLFLIAHPTFLSTLCTWRGTHKKHHQERDEAEILRTCRLVSSLKSCLIQQRIRQRRKKSFKLSALLPCCTRKQHGSDESRKSWKFTLKFICSPQQS